jgi:NADH:ubiquinone oxidoreductase subunit E
LQESLKQALTAYRGQRGATIPALQKVQETLGYLSEEAMAEVASILGMSNNEIYGVATFYAQFRFEKPGEHNIKCCLGTACYVQGSSRILDAVEDELKLPPGRSTTDDFKFSVERVACLGSCALAPVMVVDDKAYGRLTPAKAREILGKI